MDRRRLLLVVAAVIAALGVALVFVYARGAENRAADKYDAVKVLVAQVKILPGESIDEAMQNGKVVTASVTKDQLLDGASASTEALRGKVALTTIYPQEQLVPVKFGGVDEVEAAATLPIPEGKLAISIAVDIDDRVGAFVRAGAQVAVILTQEGASARVLLDRVTVLAAGAITSVPTDGEEAPEASDDVQSLLTLAVTQRDAEKLRFSETVGVLSLALLNDASQVKPDDGVGNSNLFR